jgi:NTE family protein
MGADIVIAVNIGTPLGTREDIQSLPGMLSQVIGVTTIESDRRNLRLANIVIAPKLGKYSLLNFTASKAIADLGYKGAEAEASALTPLSLDNGSWREYVAKRQSRKRSSVETPLALEIEGVKGRSSEDITRTLDSDLKSPIDSHKLDRQLNEIRGGGRYASLGYDVAMQEKEPRLRIRVAEKPFAPPMLIPVLLIQASGSSTVDLSAGFRLTNFDLGGYGSELRTDVLIGSNDLFALEYYHPFGKSGFFVAPRAYYSFQRQDLYQSGDRLAEYNVKKVAAAADAGIIFNRKSQLRVGFEVGHEKADVSIGSPLLPNVSGAFIDASASYVWDGQDSAVIPTRGVRFSGVASWFFKSAGASQGFPQAVLSASWFKPLSEKSTLFAYGMGGTSFGKKPGPIQQFAIGGPFRLSAYGLGELRGNNVANGGVGYLRRVGYLPPFLGNKIYLGGWYEGGSAFSNSTLRGYANDVAGAAVVETFMGPVTIGGSLGEGGRGRVFFSLGRLF